MQTRLKGGLVRDLFAQLLGCRLSRLVLLPGDIRLFNILFSWFQFSNRIVLSFGLSCFNAAVC